MMLKKKTFVWLDIAGTNGRSILAKTRMPLLALVWIAPVLVALALLTAANLATVEAASAEEAAEGTFKSTCAMCHGADGSGDTPVGKSMHIPDLQSAQVQKQSDAQLAEAISNGKNAMPPFKGNLNPDQINALVAHVRQLNQQK